MDFVRLLSKDGLLLYNSSLIEQQTERSDIRTIAVPATEIADSLGKELNPEIFRDTKDTRFVANSVLFGAFLATSEGKTAKNHLDATLHHFLAGKKAGLLELNKLAVERGIKHVEAQSIAA